VTSPELPTSTATSSSSKPSPFSIDSIMAPDFKSSAAAHRLLPQPSLLRPPLPAFTHLAAGLNPAVMGSYGMDLSPALAASLPSMAGSRFSPTATTDLSLLKPDPLASTVAAAAVAADAAASGGGNGGSSNAARLPPIKPSPINPIHPLHALHPHPHPHPHHVSSAGAALSAAAAVAAMARMGLPPSLASSLGVGSAAALSLAECSALMSSLGRDGAGRFAASGLPVHGRDPSSLVASSMASSLAWSRELAASVMARDYALMRDREGRGVYDDDDDDDDDRDSLGGQKERSCRSNGSPSLLSVSPFPPPPPRDCSSRGSGCSEVVVATPVSHGARDEEEERARSSSPGPRSPSADGTQADVECRVQKDYNDKRESYEDKIAHHEKSESDSESYVHEPRNRQPPPVSLSLFSGPVSTPVFSRPFLPVEHSSHSASLALSSPSS
jgi:hypothetical protein